MRGRDGARGQAAVKQWIRMCYLPDEGPAVPVWVLWEYSAETPLEVGMTFPVADGNGWSKWVFARSLLIGGAYAACGEGDVRVWPVEHDVQPWVSIALSDGSLSALLQVSREDLLAWTAGMLERVPVDAESGHLDVDGCIRRILEAADG
ncbi:SsgA family sporulation/cell division regulator [Streptomyces sp. IBSNAI002]|uniref:SsgA family sporulation/cell division regulator n=1 Tax=Streptomyces sp. IBSNAI002 TaxID=3457500 RepID=UPI003FD18B11